MTYTERSAPPPPNPDNLGDMGYVEYSAVRHVFGAVREFISSPVQWVRARRLGSSAVGETVLPNGITVVEQTHDELTYVDYSAVRGLAKIAGRRID
jgi:hypothetical protein